MLKDNITELEVEMTTLCNAKCPLCYRNYKSFKTSKYNVSIIRPLNDLIKQLDSYKNLSFVMLVGSMSEPTLYPNFIDLVKYLKSRKIKIEICTNGDTNDDSFWSMLGKELSNTDMVYFTICGSTQEMHEHYRKGTKLSNILKNAMTLRMQKPIDYAQCIRFNYNSDDFDSVEFKNIVKQFSHIYFTETFYPKNLDNYTDKFDYNDYIPNKVKLNKYNKIKYIAEYRYNSNINHVAQCQSIEFNRQQLDVFGNNYPCYLFLEHMNGKEWDNNYNNVISMQYSCCKFCDKYVHDYCQKTKLDYII